MGETLEKVHCEIYKSEDGMFYGHVANGKALYNTEHYKDKVSVIADARIATTNLGWWLFQIDDKTSRQ